MVARPVDKLHHEGGPQKPGDFLRFTPDRPGFFTRCEEGKPAEHLLQGCLVAQAWVEGAFRAGVAEHGVTAAPGYHAQLTRVDRGPVKLEPPSAARRPQFAQGPA